MSYLDSIAQRIQKHHSTITERRIVDGNGKARGKEMMGNSELERRETLTAVRPLDNNGDMFTRLYRPVDRAGS